MTTNDVTIIVNLAASPPPYTILELTEYARHRTEREEDAAKLERRILKSAFALLLSGRVGESFAAIVTGASEREAPECGSLNRQLRVV